MSMISTNPENELSYTDQKDVVKERFIAKLKELGKSFWNYTEETGQSDTSTFDGWM